jgi:hypothetical protein
MILTAAEKDWNMIKRDGGAEKWVKTWFSLAAEKELRNDSQMALKG